MLKSMKTPYDYHREANTENYRLVAWKEAFEVKYKEMGFSAEKISGIRFSFDEMSKMTFNMNSSMTEGWEKLMKGHTLIDD